MMGRPDERHKTMRPPNCAPAPSNPLSYQAAQFANWVWAKHSCKTKYWADAPYESIGENIWCQCYPIPRQGIFLILSPCSWGLLWDCLPGFNPILKSESKATCHAIDNILQRDLGFFSHLCLPVGIVGGGRVCDEPASTLPSLCSSLNKGVPAFQTSKTVLVAQVLYTKTVQGGQRKCL